MNHLSPCQRFDGRWEFTLQNGPTAYPIGYCRGEPGLSKPGFAHRYHEDGHASAEESAECYHRFLVDQMLELIDPPPHPKAMFQCEAFDCNTFTAGLARCMTWRAHLCDAHRNSQTVSELMPVSLEYWTTL